MKNGLAEKKCRMLQWMEGRGVLEVFFIQGVLDDLQSKSSSELATHLWSESGNTKMSRSFWFSSDFAKGLSVFMNGTKTLNTKILQIPGMSLQSSSITVRKLPKF